MLDLHQPSKAGVSNRVPRDNARTMIGVSFQLPIWFDLDAVFLLAMTGVWAAGRRGYDSDTRGR